MIKKPPPEMSLIEIARTSAIGPIKHDLDISAIGPILGAPDFWGFHLNDDCFCSWMNFGEVEIGFKAKENIVKVDYAKFYISQFNNGRLKFYRNGRNRRTYLVNNFSSRRPTFAVVASAMQKAKIDYRTKIENFVVDETWGVMQFDGNMKFYFNCKEGNLFSIEKSRLNFVAIES